MDQCMSVSGFGWQTKDIFVGGVTVNSDTNIPQDILPPRMLERKGEMYELSAVKISYQNIKIHTHSNNVIFIKKLTEKLDFDTNNFKVG